MADRNKKTQGEVIMEITRNIFSLYRTTTFPFHQTKPGEIVRISKQGEQGENYDSMFCSS